MSRSAHLRPAPSIEDYASSTLRMKVEHATRLIRWVLAWMRDVQDMSLDAAMDGLAHAKRLRRSAAALENYFEEAAIAAMYETGTSEYIGTGYGAVLRPGTDRRGWRNDALVSELVEQAVDRARAKHPDLPARAVRQIVTESMWGMYAVGRLEWRSTDLRKRGINPDDFSDRVQAVPTIDLRGQASYAEPIPGQGREPAVWEARR